jgi:transcriptional regulator with XRE-family HTH domain
VDFHSIRARFKQAREAAGLSQGDVARHFEVDRGTAYRWECGHSRIHLDVLLKAAELFRCDRYWLVFGEAQPRPRRRSKGAA